ncbi:hypothetical protein NQ314_020508 [Rhamnusium bicolor]|uniref:Macro domain-containing protein n=1 Tax=Rhamnusium bicolor TaxID=1586634 RepID=A0AAV8WKF2_9CUCU|nr:hypothetical protein NQ314_020508 [Rhamnusium bicolor]
MNAGIAAQFKRRFNSVNFLISQQQEIGGLAVLPNSRRFIYYLVTKNLFFDQPTYESLYSSLCQLKQHIVNNNIANLAIPALGCGLDGLFWPKVRSLIFLCFSDLNLNIVVYHYLPGVDIKSSNSKENYCKLNNSFMPTADEWNKWLAIVRDFYIPSDLSPLCSTMPGDTRPYLEVEIDSVPVTCLLDSGASNTIIGWAGLDFFGK